MSRLRRDRLGEISQRLGDRRLIWFGIRGEDAAPLLAVPQFTAAFSVTAALRAGKLEESIALEDLTRHRVDLDVYDIDLDRRPEVDRLRSALLCAVARPSAVVSYRPSELLSSATFAARHTCRHLGLFKDRQVAFEHKPWVETELSDQGILTIPWAYVPTERRRRLPLGPGRPPLVLRPSRTSGGVGIFVVRTADEVEQAWQDDTSHLMGVAPYLKDALPLNVNGCVWADGEVTLHPLSVQLIGIAELTSRPFGYCGNDFAAIRDLNADVLTAVDETSRAIGRWLGQMGYRGAFGVDYLLDGDVLHFAEVNPRMQGSTRLSSALAARTGHVDVVLDHLSAFLGLPPAETLSLADWVAELPPAAQVIKHVDGVRLVDALDLSKVPGSDRARVSLLPRPGVRLEPGAVEYCLELDRRVTSSGFDLLDPPLVQRAPVR